MAPPSVGQHCRLCQDWTSPPLYTETKGAVAMRLGKKSPESEPHPEPRRQVDPHHVPQVYKRPTCMIFPSSASSCVLSEWTMICPTENFSLFVADPVNECEEDGYMGPIVSRDCSPRGPCVNASPYCVYALQVLVDISTGISCCTVGARTSPGKTAPPPGFCSNRGALRYVSPVVRTR